LAIDLGILADEQFKHALCYSRHVPPLRPEFDARTVLSIAKAAQWKRPQPDYTSDIYVDGISESKRIEYANELRKVGVHVRRMHWRGWHAKLPKGMRKPTCCYNVQCAGGFVVEL